VSFFLALNAAAQILHLGHGPEEPVVHIGVLGDQSLKFSARLRRGIGGIALHVSFARIGGACLILVGLTWIGFVVGHSLSYADLAATSRGYQPWWQKSIH
jgi:hypothetical protein